MKKACALAAAAAMLTASVLCGAASGGSAFPGPAPPSRDNPGGLVQRIDTAGMRAALLQTGREGLQARLMLIAGARKTLDVGTYLFADDGSGRLVASALMAAADRGVRVRVLTDGLIGRLNGGDLRYVLGAHQNMELRFYNPVNSLSLDRLNARCHEKCLLADRRALVLGGRNISDGFLGDPGQPGYSQDLDVLFLCAKAGEDTAAEALAAYFDRLWDEHCAPAYASVPEGKALPVAALENELRSLYDAYCQENPELLSPEGWTGDTVPVQGYSLLVNPTEPGAGDPLLWAGLTGLMMRAQSRVWVLTPYLVLDGRMRDDLEAVAARVPDVTVLINSRAAGDNLIASADYLLSKRMFEGMRLRLREYLGSVSLHTKALLIDGDAGAVGTFNFDMRSAYIDTEVMLVVYGGEFNALLERYMRGMLALSSPANAAAGEEESAPQETEPPAPVKDAVIHFLAPLVTLMRPLL